VKPSLHGMLKNGAEIRLSPTSVIRRMEIGPTLRYCRFDENS